MKTGGTVNAGDKVRTRSGEMSDRCTQAVEEARRGRRARSAADLPQTRRTRRR